VEQNLLSEVRKVSKKTFYLQEKNKNPPWLVNSLNELKKNKEIIITEADKNMGVVVMSTTDYIKEGLRQLQDASTYILLPEPPIMSSIWKNIEDILEKHDKLHYSFKGKQQLTRLAKYLLQLKEHSALRLGTFYLLMKVHKTPVVGRPIVSSINTVTYFTSKYVDMKLQPLYRLIPSFIESSHTVINFLEKTTFHDPCVILCADVDSLYPNIPTDIGIIMMKNSITNLNGELPEDTKLDSSEIDLICDLMQFILHNNYFNFGTEVYHQINGTAMGTPAAVVFACLFLNDLEQQVMQETRSTPFLYKRFIDDIFAVFQTHQEAEIYLQRFNNVLPTIHCTNYTISNKSGIFLDLEIYKGTRFNKEGKFDLKVYQKPQNKYLYLTPNSFHSKSVFPAFIVSELNRYRLCCNNDTEFNEVKLAFYKRLVARGYEDTFLSPLFSKHKQRPELLDILQRRIERKNRNEHSSEKVVFKIQYKPETRIMNLRNCIKLPDYIHVDDRYYNIFGRQDPIISYSNPPSISKFFSQNRKTLHNSIDSVNTHRNDIDSQK
jgi:hypothetical protein